jgi:hypothetical protein
MNTTTNTVSSIGGVTVREWVMVCLTCQVEVVGYPDRDEAAYFAGVHDGLHHGRTPVAFPVEITDPDTEQVPLPDGFLSLRYTVSPSCCEEPDGVVSGAGGAA